MDHGGLILSQPERGYRYSLDPFLLADFCVLRRRGPGHQGRRHGTGHPEGENAVFHGSV